MNEGRGHIHIILARVTFYFYVTRANFWMLRNLNYARCNAEQEKPHESLCKCITKAMLLFIIIILFCGLK